MHFDFFAMTLCQNIIDHFFSSHTLETEPQPSAPNEPQPSLLPLTEKTRERIANRVVYLK